ncbi:MAG: hypothetical protein JWR89_696 [Tardiphaga sp.]|jgi:hypothetical protein|nr:hypothetical protein [Tardiphaga sp.]
MCILEKLLIGFGVAAGVGATASGLLMALAILA